MQKTIFQAQFGSIFFYSLPVYGLSRHGGKVEKKTSSFEAMGTLSSRELIIEKNEASRKLFKLEINRMKRLSTLIEDKNILSDKEKKSVLVEAKQKIDSVSADFKLKLKTVKNEDEIDSLYEKAQDDMEQVKEIVNQAVEIAKRRTAMKEGLRNHQGKVYAEIWDYHETLNEYKDDAAWKHLKLVTVAYLHKWREVNSEAIDKLNSSELNLLYSQFDKNKKEFISGKLLDNLNEIKREIKTGVMDKWLKGKEREVYKSEDWTDGFNEFKQLNPYLGNKIFDSDRDIFDDFDKFVNRGDGRLEQLNQMLDSIPLPDWGEDEPVKMTSDLNRRYFRKLEKRIVAETMKQRTALFSKIKKLSGTVQTQELEKFYAKHGMKNAKGVLIDWPPKYHRAKYVHIIHEEMQIMKSLIDTYSTKSSTKISDKQIDDFAKKHFIGNDVIVPLNNRFIKNPKQKAELLKLENLENKYKKNGIDIQKVKGRIPKVLNDEAFLSEYKNELEKEMRILNQTKIQSVFLSVSKKGLNIDVKGKNLDKTSFKPFKLSYKDMKVKAFMNVGKSNIDNKFTIHNAVKSYIKVNLQRFAEQNKIPNEKISGLPSEEMKKMEALVVKRYAPSFKVVGSASFDGGYSYNKQLARRRMNAAVARIRSQYGKNIKIEKVAMVVDNEGKEVKPSGISAAWKNVQASYNDEFGKKLTVSQIKRKLELYDNKNLRKKMNIEERLFFEESFGANRNVEVQLIPTKNKKPLEITLKVNNSGTEANTQFVSNSSAEDKGNDTKLPLV